MLYEINQVLVLELVLVHVGGASSTYAEADRAVPEAQRAHTRGLAAAEDAAEEEAMAKNDLY